MDPRLLEMMQMMAMASQGQGIPYSGSVNENNPFSYHEAASLMPEEDSFFGPIGTAIANMVPGLHTTGVDGNPTPIFKTNFRLKNSGMTGWQNLLLQQNRKAYAEAARGQNQGMSATMSTLFGEDGAVGQLIDKSDLPDSVKGVAKSASAFLAANPGIANSAINSVLGYDRGVGASVVNQNSPWMAASYMTRANMQNTAPINGDIEEMDSALATTNKSHNLKDYTRNEMKDYNPFGEDFTKIRAGLSSIATGATQQIMYDGAIKKDSVHGASEAFVADVVSKAIGSGQAEKILAEKGGPSIQQAIELRESKRSEIERLTAQKEEKEKEIKEARARGDTEAELNLEMDPDNGLSAIAEKLKKASEEFDTVSKTVADGLSPLVESVTGVVSSLKDFYGDEQQAREALDRLTGGQGSKDKAVADRVRTELTEVKALGAMAGLDPKVTGGILETNRQMLGRSGSTLSEGSGAHGAQSIAFTKDLLRQLRGAGLSQEEAGRQIEAYNEGVGAWGESHGKKVATMLMYARQKGLFGSEEEGYTDEYRELEDLLRSGSVADMEEVERRLGTKQFGSVEAFKEFINNPQNIALVNNMLEGSSQTDLAELGVDMRNNEMDRAGAFGGRKADIARRQAALKQAGISQTEISNELGGTSFDAMSQFLSGEGGDETAAKGLNDEYQAALEELKKQGKDVADPQVQKQAKGMAAQRFKSRGYMDLLTPEQQDEMRKQELDIQKEGLKSLEYFAGRSGGTISAKKGGFFESVGASDESGITKASMSAAVKDMASALTTMGASAKTKDGQAIDAKAITAFQDKYQDLMKSGDFEGARDLVENFTSNMDESTSKRLKATLNKKVYRTDSNIRATEASDDELQEILRDEKTSRIMNGMSEDNKREYIKMQKARIAAATPEEKAELGKKIKEMEDAAEKESQSDAEKAIKAFQTQDWEKFADVLRSGNVAVEDFVNAIRKAAGALGGLPVSADEAARAAKTSDASRTEYLQGAAANLGLAGRLTLSEDINDARDHLEALNGNHHVLEGKKKSYVEYLKKAQKGDRKSYEEALDIEKGQISSRNIAIQKRQEELGKIVGNSSYADIKKELDALGKDGDPKKKDKLEKKLAAARELEQLAQEQSGLELTQKSISEEREKVKGMSDSQFKEYIQSSVETNQEQLRAREGAGQGAGANGPAANGQVDFAGLFSRLDRLCNFLEHNQKIKGDNT